MKKTLVASVLAFAALSAAQAKDIVDTAGACGPCPWMIFLR